MLLRPLSAAEPFALASDVIRTLRDSLETPAPG